MQLFQKIVLFSAIAVLILMLVFIGYSLRQSVLSAWPPLIAECPDYWVDMSGNGSKCVNVQNLGNGTCKASGTDTNLTMDFTQPAFVGGNALCSKYTWATNCGVTWDGITYGVPNPCDTPGNYSNVSKSSSGNDSFSSFFSGLKQNL